MFSLGSGLFNFVYYRYRVVLRITKDTWGGVVNRYPNAESSSFLTVGRNFYPTFVLELLSTFDPGPYDQIPPLTVIFRDTCPDGGGPETTPHSRKQTRPTVKTQHLKKSRVRSYLSPILFYFFFCFV